MSQIYITTRTLRELVLNCELPRLEYNPHWVSENDRFNGLFEDDMIDSVPLDDGQLGVCFDDAERLMLIGRYCGELYVVYQRHAPQASRLDSTLVFQHAGPPAETLLRHLLEIEGETVSTNELQRYLLAFANTATLISLIQREIDDVKYFARQQASNPQATPATTDATTTKENDSMNAENTQNTQNAQDNAAQKAAQNAEAVQKAAPAPAPQPEYSNWKKAGWAAGGVAVGAAVGYGLAAAFGTDLLDGLFD